MRHRKNSPARCRPNSFRRPKTANFTDHAAFVGRKQPILPSKRLRCRPSSLQRPNGAAAAENGRFCRPSGASAAERGQFRRRSGFGAGRTRPILPATRLWRRPSGVSATDDRLSAPRAPNSSNGLWHQGHKVFHAPPRGFLYTPQRPKQPISLQRLKQPISLQRLKAVDFTGRCPTFNSSGLRHCGYRDFHLKPESPLNRPKSTQISIFAPQRIPFIGKPPKVHSRGLYGAFSSLSRALFVSLPALIRKLQKFPGHNSKRRTISPKKI